jgi:predicted RNase H-related nuclease YkuK (DUF458 family)
MKLNRIWVVTIPTQSSTLQDICFFVDAVSLAKQFKGGLEPESIYAFYTDKKEAENAAQWFLDERDHDAEMIDMIMKFGQG